VPVIAAGLEWHGPATPGCAILLPVCRSRTLRLRLDTSSGSGPQGAQLGAIEATCRPSWGPAADRQLRGRPSRLRRNPPPRSAGPSRSGGPVTPVPHRRPRPQPPRNQKNLIFSAPSVPERRTYKWMTQPAGNALRSGFVSPTAETVGHRLLGIDAISGAKNKLAAKHMDVELVRLDSGGNPVAEPQQLVCVSTPNRSPLLAGAPQGLRCPGRASTNDDLLAAKERSP